MRGGHLPSRSKSLVGRQQISDEIVALLGRHRLVTLTGAGGVGKTALAIDVADRMRGHFPDGAWIVELGAVGESAAVPLAIASVLGITPQGDVDPIETVAEAVAGRRLLLVVDNCEHVSAAAATTIGRILTRSPTSTVLATSRESLWVAGEQRCSLTPLGTDGGPASDAVALFVDRARSIRSEFALSDPATSDAVVEICRTLDGLPLAIELAAARMASMTATELCQRLADRFRLLTSVGHRPARQQTLEQLVAWSTDLLAEPDRAALRAASVFSGGFGLRDLMAVTADTDELGVLDRVDSLVHKSLLVADPDGGATRYRLLETIRQYAQDHLCDEQTLVSLRDRHARHFGDEAAARWERWNGPGWRAAADWVESAHANLRAAFRWSATRGDIAVATDVAAHAAVVGVTVQLFEMTSWAEELIEAATAADVPRLPRLLTAAGLACFAGRAMPAAEYAHRATELETDPRYEPCEPGYATFVEALARVYCGDLRRYVELSANVAARTDRAMAYGIPAYVDGLQASGRVDDALALTETAVEAARELGNPFWIAYALWTAGLAHAHRDARRALAAWDEGLEVVRQHRATFFEGFLSRDAAREHAIAGDMDTSLTLFSTAIEVFRRSGNVPQLVITVASVPAVLERLGHFEAAATLYAAIVRQPESLGHVPDLADVALRLQAGMTTDHWTRCAAAGAKLDLRESAAYALRQIALALDDVRRAGTAPRGGLTRRELEVVRLVADGLSTADVARRLFISRKTADHHIQHIYTKVGVTNRAAITRWAIDNDLLG